MPYNHRSNGLTKRCNRNVVGILRKFCSKDPTKTWWSWIEKVEWNHNRFFHRNLQMIPVEEWCLQQAHLKDLKGRREDNRRRLSLKRPQITVDYKPWDRAWVLQGHVALGRKETRLHGPCYVVHCDKGNAWVVCLVSGLDLRVHSELLRPFKK